MDPHPEETIENFGLGDVVDFDWIEEDYLEGGAVAATARKPKLEPVDNLGDAKNYEGLFAGPDGQLYGVSEDKSIGFIGDIESYSNFDYPTIEHSNLHESQHYIQFDEDQLWGDTMDEVYGVSDDLRKQLNKVDRLRDLNDHPLYGRFIDDARVTGVVEGYTERVTQSLQENGEEIGEGFYPGYTQLAENTMKADGIDIDEELEP
ncbi:hypothetical protein LC1Nh_0330 [Candidatus Nanohalobium constans]|uniref:Uncharacterized protein n=2 Tax=Candidatus Nanohalobium constans TaxID=2565781 RepID=A0A5Q0UFS3_9ARCH|nr:hypothetical protein LC1Nh_0330 [Candidatus Nanohalobium constans]